MASPSLDYFVRPRQHVGRDRQADLFRRFQIDNELKLRRLFHRKVGGLGSLQDFVHVGGGTAEQVGKVRAVGHKASSLYKFWKGVYRRKPALSCEVCNLFSLRREERAWKHEDCVSTSLACGSECSLNILGTLDVEVLKLHSKCRCGEFRLF